MFFFFFNLKLRDNSEKYCFYVYVLLFLNFFITKFTISVIFFFHFILLIA